MKRSKKVLTTPEAIFRGFVLVAFAIASLPYSSQLVPQAHAAAHDFSDYSCKFLAGGKPLETFGQDGRNVWEYLQVIGQEHCAGRNGF